MKIEFLGHAGICIKTNNSKIVMDGWFTKNGAFDGASMLETYEATRADAYSQKDTLASVIEAPCNEMIYMLDPSQGPGNTTDESESLMSVAMMTVETVGL